MPDWTDRKVEKLRDLWDQGLSTAEIGKKLGVSKNAVVGKVHRLGLEGRAPQAAKAPAPASAKAKNPPPRPAPGKKKTPPAPPVASRSVRVPMKPHAPKTAVPERVKAPQKSAAPAAAKPKSGVPLVDLVSDQCCWPADGGEGEAQLFCGKKVFKSKPYCLEHCILAYNMSGADDSARTGEAEEPPPADAAGLPSGDDAE